MRDHEAGADGGRWVQREGAADAIVPESDFEPPRGMHALRGAGLMTVAKTMSILEIVARPGGASARDISDALGYPLPTVYRLLQSLVQLDYLVHIKDKHRYELGYRLDDLGLSLRRQVGASMVVHRELLRLHDTARVASYFAVYRGPDVVVAEVVDSPEHPRLKPLNFGFHEAGHATAFGKIMLAGMTSRQVGEYLDGHGMPQLTDRTITTRRQLEENLAVVGQLNVAWEREEFIPGVSCAAVGIRNGAGALLGAVAISLNPPTPLGCRDGECSCDKRG